MAPSTMEPGSEVAPDVYVECEANGAPIRVEPGPGIIG